MSELQPAAGEIRALIVPNDDPLTRGFSSFLGKQQRARCRRYHEHQDRQAASVCKGLWRLGAGVLLGCDPRDVAMDRDEWNRPCISEQGRKILDLNVSRTPTHSALVVARGVRVGVDIETVSARMLSETLVSMVVQEQDRVEGYLQDPESFFELWTHKEAVLKADGRGLGIDPKSVTVPGSLSGPGVWSLCGCDGSAWQATALKSPGSIKGAVGADSVPGSFEQIPWERIQNHPAVRGSCARPHAMNP